MTEKSDVKLAMHIVEQAEKHVELMKERSSDEQYHLESIMLLLQDAMKMLHDGKNKN